jgi:hypothetical protein
MTRAGRPDDQAHDVEHDLDPPDDADRFDELPVYGPPAALPDVDPPRRRCAHLRTFADRTGTVVCRDCWQVVDWLRG